MIQRIRLFIHHQYGMATVELALLMPFLLVLLLGGIELSRYIMVHQKLTRTTVTVADLVTQGTDASTTDLDNIMQVVPHIMNPFTFGDDGLVIVSHVKKLPGNAPSITWQYTGGGSLSETSAIGLAGDAAALPGGFTMNDEEGVIIAEVYYRYDDMVVPDVLPITTVYKRAFYRPRLGELDVLQ